MPFIDRDFINDLPNRVDIVGLINKRVSLKKAGKDYKACCPFHEEKTPSFTVVPTKQIYHCFGCGESGGIIDFIMKYDHLAFVEAIETVAGESGVSVVYDQTAKPVDKRFERYNKLMSELSEFYQNQLNSYTSQYNSLSSEEKIIFAETIAANKAILDEYNALTADFNQSASALRTTQTVQDYETQVEISKGKFVASVIYQAAYDDKSLGIVGDAILCHTSRVN